LSFSAYLLLPNSPFSSGGYILFIYVLFNYDCSCLHSVGSVCSMTSELESMWKKEAAWRFPVGIHKNRVSRSSYRFSKLGNVEFKKGMLTTRPSWNTLLNGVRRWSVYSWRASFDTGNCIAWNRMGHKEEFYMRPTRLAWITYELKPHQHLLFWNCQLFWLVLLKDSLWSRFHVPCTVQPTDFCSAKFHCVCSRPRT
jgi:hypothetical protein